MIAATAAIAALGASAASGASGGHLQLKSEGKALASGGEVLFVGGYALGTCYSEEQPLKLAANGAATDKLTRGSESGQLEGCTGGVQSVELSAAHKMTVKMAPLRIHLAGPCVYEFKVISGAFQQTSWGPELSGTATGSLYKHESKSAGCAGTDKSFYDIALIGVETAVT